ncbi:MAG: hypothetical protein A2266_00775 [Bacteroidetes bacterium RIFOXYA12_FULL_40_10]|jgi:predicted nuclease of restriction endonuclease-like (RecB) superfamily|nr:MAG: hypothetical protein A2X20_08940 [Bacteroidetes bacterium GWE2_40_15]OFY90830.1 MAG: hypothetical protein A2266_00775 [Bacteroidetes bacterium RIFOXYA12_FULL_40_10]PKP07024.1 MAG: hypothetical protein CVU10_05575 [Bacteroidetes bacterium HGW-Bacteroidetes-5]HBZ25499.1 hypothetical protein [Rikenellaceae bacterium]
MDKRFADIIQLIKQSRTNAIRAVNAELISLYWNIGEYISKKIEQSEWGDSVVTELAKYIQQNEPEIKGFSDKNLWRMKQFYETYKGYPKISTVLREISWSHNLTIDRDIKRPNENPSIGILLCKDKDSEVVEYALSRSLSPTMVSEYKTQLPDKKLLQQKLHELFNKEIIE